MTTKQTSELQRGDKVRWSSDGRYWVWVSYVSYVNIQDGVSYHKLYGQINGRGKMQCWSILPGRPAWELV
jgi:hypothetical protein